MFNSYHATGGCPGNEGAGRRGNFGGKEMERVWRDYAGFRAQGRTEEMTRGSGETGREGRDTTGLRARGEIDEVMTEGWGEAPPNEERMNEFRPNIHREIHVFKHTRII